MAVTAKEAKRKGPAWTEIVYQKRATLRVAAAVLLLAVIGVLIWGAVWQRPEGEPFKTPGLFAWLFHPEPHRAYRGMPVVPLGSSLGLVPRNLCADPDDCGGLKVEPDGRAVFQDTIGKIWNVARLHRSSGSGQLFAITPSGELFALAVGTKSAWRQVSLPAHSLGLEKSSTSTLTNHAGRILFAGFSPDGRRIVTASEDNTARILEVTTAKEVGILRGHTDVVNSAAFSPDGSRIVTASGDRTARIWDARSAQEIAILRGHDDVVNSAAFSPDGSRIVTASRDRTGRIWDAGSGRLIAVLRGDSDVVNSAAFSPDGSRIVTASGDRTARIWDAQSARQIAILRGHDDVVNSATFSPDGSRIVTASRDRTVRIWDAASAKEIAVLRGHDDVVNSATFSPDGSRIVTASRDRTVRIWDAASAKEIAFLRGHEDVVNSAAFSRDGSHVVTASLDRTHRIWDVASGRQRGEEKPFVRSIASSTTGALWVVGADCYAAYSLDGRSWTSVTTFGDDFLAVAAVGPENAVALAEKNNLTENTFVGNTLIFLNKDAQLIDFFPSRQQQQKDGSGRLLSGGIIPGAGGRRLKALFFQDSNNGWVAGADGLILRTTDAGQNWSKLHERVGLALADLHLEPSGIGWAVGEHSDGHKVVVAANRAEFGLGADGWREMPYHVAPWYFLLGIPGLLLAGFLNLRAWRPDPPPPIDSIEEVATSDEPLRWSDPDASALKPLARGLSRFLRNINTKPPLTLAITGRWGSGKSSLMRLLMADLRRYGGRAVWFNAWHHNEEEHLLAALFEAIRREAPPGWWSWPGLAFRLRLFWARSKRPLLNLTYLMLFAAIALVTLHLALPSFRAEEIRRMAHSAVQLLDKEVAQTWQAALVAALAGSGSVALLGFWLRGKLMALPANPAKLVAALARRASLGDFSDKLAFRHHFGEQFEDVCNALLTRTSPGLVILIDDLDRCQPADVLKVLEAVNYLVSAGPCTIVLGMDRRQVEYCVGLGFEKLVEGLPDDELIYADDETSDKAGKQRAYARHYLEKLINIEVPVPSLDDVATDALLLRGMSGKRLDDGDGPVWLQTAKRVWSGAFQVARVGLLAFLVGILLTWVVDWWREPDSITASTPPVTAISPPQRDNVSPLTSVPQEQQGATFEPARVEVELLPPTRELPRSRRWLWWAPTVLLTGIAILFGAAAVFYRERQVVRDSPDFATALRSVKPLLAVINATPRAIKRYQNRMRYLAARLRPSIHEPDRIDTFVHWLGGRLDRQLVPPAWFEERPRQAISEPALILLGAVEFFAPKAFANPGELFAGLEHTTPGDARSIDRTAAWSRVREAFAKENLAMPTPAEVSRYAAFVLIREPAIHLQPAEVVRFPRDPTSGPRSA